MEVKERYVPLLAVLQLLKTFHVLHGNRVFIPVFTNLA